MLYWRGQPEASRSRVGWRGCMCMTCVGCDSARSVALSRVVSLPLHRAWGDGAIGGMHGADRIDGTTASGRQYGQVQAVVAPPGDRPPSA